MRIAIASDHAGYKHKQKIIGYLQEMNYEFRDFGTYSEESSDYTDYAHPLAEAISNGEYERGIVLCGSGNGVNITVNKHQKIRSALCWIAEIASLARKHNDANVCAIPARFVSEDESIGIVKAFLKDSFEGGRHQRRIDKIPIK